jgi:hypothetical protein
VIGGSRAMGRPAECPVVEPHMSGRGRHPPHTYNRADAVTSARFSAPAHASVKRKVSALVNFTSSSGENKTQFNILRWVAWRVSALGARMFAVDDRFALQHGWEITRRWGGLARTYRDPRFDSLHACSRCGGRGVAEGATCLPCEGTGRVTRGAPQFEGQSP